MTMEKRACTYIGRTFPCEKNIKEKMRETYPDWILDKKAEPPISERKTGAVLGRHTHAYPHTQ